MTPFFAASDAEQVGSTVIGGGVAALVIALALPLIRMWDKRADSTDKAVAKREDDLRQQITNLTHDASRMHESIGAMNARLEAQARSIGELAAKVQMLETQNSTLLADNQRLVAANHGLSIENVRLKGEVNGLLDDMQKPQRYTL